MQNMTTNNYNIYNYIYFFFFFFFFFSLWYGGPFVSKLISGIGDKYVKKYRPDKNIGSVSGRIGLVLKK